LSILPHTPEAVSPARASPYRPAGLSPAVAFSDALDDTLRLLFRPFDTRRWIKLSAVCLFLGGGTASAALQWSLGTLPRDIRLSEGFAQVRQYVAQHFWLLILVTLLGLAVGLVLLYVRAVFRFVLVDCIIRREAHLRLAWTALRAQGRSYFLWLLSALVALGAAFSAITVVTYPYLRATAAAGTHPLRLSLILVAILATVVLLGLFVAVAITLTDDLVVPVMYAGRASLPATWGKLWLTLRAEPRSFVAYLLLRFAVSVAVSVAVLFLLFPALVSVFSGAIITGALVILGLHLIGIAWVWNTFTIFLGMAALLVLSGVLLILLSVVGMPGQVLLQSFGMQFIASRFPSLEVLWRMSAARRRR
jgi:hypothetical protein